MTASDYGPLDTYEITWMSGHVETIQAHQVTHKARASKVAVLGAGEFGTTADAERIVFHGEINGHWTVVLLALVEDIRTVRRITDGEQLTAEGGEQR